MPAKSKKQRRMMAIAEHEPEMLHEENKGVMKMEKEEMHKMAATKEKGLPASKLTDQQKFEKMRMKQGAKKY